MRHPWGYFILFQIICLILKKNNSEHRELYSNMDMRIEYTIFLMMRLKSFRPEIDKKLAAPERMPKIK
jgi:hypothetical protein